MKKPASSLQGSEAVKDKDQQLALTDGPAHDGTNSTEATEEDKAKEPQPKDTKQPAPKVSSKAKAKAKAGQTPKAKALAKQKPKNKSKPKVSASSKAKAKGKPKTQKGSKNGNKKGEDHEGVKKDEQDAQAGLYAFLLQTCR